MRKLLSVLALCVVFLVGCEGLYDYTTEEMVDAVRNDKGITGYTVIVEVDKIEESLVGYSIPVAEDVVLMSLDKPDFEEGDTVIVEIKSVAKAFGIYLVSFTR